MQSKFQSHKMNFRVNFLLDCILDEIFAVYEFNSLTVMFPYFTEMTHYTPNYKMLCKLPNYID